MPACYIWNYLVIFKVHCEFIGANEALKPFNLFTICFATKIKKYWLKISVITQLQNPLV